MEVKMTEDLLHKIWEKVFLLPIVSSEIAILILAHMVHQVDSLIDMVTKNVLWIISFLVSSHRHLYTIMYTVVGNKIPKVGNKIPTENNTENKWEIVITKNLKLLIKIKKPAKMKHGLINWNLLFISRLLDTSWWKLMMKQKIELLFLVLKKQKFYGKRWTATTMDIFQATFYKDGLNNKPVFHYL